MAVLRARVAVAVGRLRADSAGAEPQCSIVVPVLNEAAILEQHLRLIRHWCRGQELIVVDGGSCDSSAKIARQYADKVLLAPRGRARQMNRGAAAASTDRLLFLHCDSAPQFELNTLLTTEGTTEGWGFCDAWPVPAGPLLQWVGVMMNLRARLSHVATGDQLLFISRALFEHVGGFADMPLMEDVDICKRLRRLQKPLALGLRVETSSRRWQSRGTVRTIIQMWRLRLAFFCGATPVELARQYDAYAEQLPLLLVQFAREPVAGKVKTRMQPHLSPDQAASLHAAMLLHTCDTLHSARLAPVQLWVAGNLKHPVFQACQRYADVALQKQPFGDLGERMKAVFQLGLQRYQGVIIVGSDAPAIDGAYLRLAAAALTRADMVLGPAADGGYVLLGLRVMAAEIFEGIAWGTEQVLAQTLTIAEDLGLDVSLLPTLFDIDRPADLQHLPDSLRGALSV